MLDMLLDMSCLNFYNLTENVITFYFLLVSQYEDLERGNQFGGNVFHIHFLMNPFHDTKEYPLILCTLIVQVTFLTSNGQTIEKKL